MIQHIKAGIQNVKIEQCRKKQDAEIRLQTDRYAQWVAENESAVGAGRPRGEGTDDFDGMYLLSFDELKGVYPFQNRQEEILLLVDIREGQLDHRAVSLIRASFAEHGSWSMIYADEDYQCGDIRIAPWMKPDWSPDTLLSLQYFGHFLAIRRAVYAKIPWLEQGSNEEKIYDFLLKCAEQSGEIAHVPQVLFHNRISEEELAEYQALNQDDPKVMTADENMPWRERDRFHRMAQGAAVSGNDTASTEQQAVLDGFDGLRRQAMERRGYPGVVQRDAYGVSHPVYEIQTGVFGKKPLVSIIIPSKDNMEVLLRCLNSIREHAGYPDYEVLVVDNGSSGATRNRLMNQEAQLGFRYYYKPMEFNFSAMVNYGAKQAQGDYILLLNDDTEVTQDDWLLRMLGQAQLPHVGAVGAKLLYPNSRLIQHVGVTNMTVGPAHKLQEESDKVSYYYGRNRYDYNCIGVTAACLLVKKEIYDAASGFDETIRVAYNDVDFCFSLLERGLYNVVRNDVVLLHYESLSRGNDLLVEEKVARLMRERGRIYAKHPQFCGKDPYYSPNLLGSAVDYIVNYRYAYETEEAYTEVQRSELTEIPQEWYNDSIFVTVEQACRRRFFEVTAQKEAYLIEGWAYVLNQENCRYDMKLLLQPVDQTVSVSLYTAEVFRRYRPDVVQILPEQKEVALSGFVARFPADTLPAGTYQILLYMKDNCSRQHLVRNTGGVLAVL